MMPAVPRISPFDRPATYHDLMKVPDIMVAEIVDGELHTTPRPADPHTKAASTLGMLVGPPFHIGRGGPGGWWILDEPELHLAADVLVPDLGGWRRERMPGRPEAAYYTVVPDWICEILSPSTARLDRTKKLAIYAREGVRHAWLIDPLARTLEVLRLDQGRWFIVATHADEVVVRAEPFDDIELHMKDLWAL
jgi:Uma2 family endonuclease